MRAILHCDLNNFYASCECLNNSELLGKPVAVGGKEEDRHGVVVAANYEAKKFGVHCGVTVHEAKKLCPDVIICPPHFDLYNKYSRLVRNIYEEYTDQVEVFSIDECWLDVTHSKIFGTPIQIANTIRERVKKEIGLTISVGVSFNKTFAKIGSDLKKPDATTVISEENFKRIVWRLPVSDMFGVGRKTTEKLLKFGINTIGDLANTKADFLKKEFGKVGEELYKKANGLDDEPVSNVLDEVVPKSIGNSTTFYKDLTERKDISLAFLVLSESVVERMIKKNIKFARTLSITVRDADLKFYQRQCKIFPSRNSEFFAKTAERLFYESFSHIKRVRLLGVAVSDFDEELQLSIFNEDKKDKGLDELMLSIRNKFGKDKIVRGSALTNEKIAKALDREQLDKNMKDDN